MLTAATMFASAVAAHDYAELDRAVYGLLSGATREPRVLTDGVLMAERFRALVMLEIQAYRTLHAPLLGGLYLQLICKY